MDMTVALTISAAAMAAFILVNRIKYFYAMAKVKTLIATGGELVIVDVRTRAEHEEKRIVGSVSVPLEQIKSNIRQFVRDETIPIAVYCLSGSRASSAAKQLKEMGYKTVVNIGGINSWKGEFESGKTKKRNK